MHEAHLDGKEFKEQQPAKDLIERFSRTKTALGSNIEKIENKIELKKWGKAIGGLIGKAFKKGDKEVGQGSTLNTEEDQKVEEDNAEKEGVAENK